MTSNAQPQPADYSLPGVMRYLQTEWQRNERDRIQWELERAEMKTRIGKLEGEKRGLELVMANQAKKIQALDTTLARTRSLIDHSENGPSSDPSSSSDPYKESTEAFDNHLKSLADIDLDLSPLVTSRQYLEKCLQEVEFLLQTSNIDQSSSESSQIDNSDPLNMPNVGFNVLTGQPNLSSSNSISSTTNTLNNINLESIPTSSSSISTSSIATAANNILPNMDRSKLPDGLDLVSEIGFNSSELPNIGPNAAENPGPEIVTQKNPLNGGALKLKKSDTFTRGNKWVLEHSLDGHQDSVRSVEFISSDQIITGGDDGSIKRWDLNADSRPIFSHRGHQGAVSALAYSPTTQLLYSAGQDRKIRIWASSQVAAISDFSGHQGYIWDLALNVENGILASASADGTVKIWDVSSRPDEVSMSIGPDGNVIGPLKTTILRPDNSAIPVAATALTFYAGGTKLVVGYEDASVQLYDVETGVKLMDFEVDGDSSSGNKSSTVNDLSYSELDTLILSAHDDGIIRYLDPETGKCLHQLQAHPGSTNALANSPAGREFVSGGDDGLVKIWSIDSHSVVQQMNCQGPAAMEGVLAVKWYQESGSTYVKNTIASAGGNTTANIYVQN